MESNRQSWIGNPIKKVNEFISSCLGHLKVYQKHAFIAKKQSNFYIEKKEYVKDGEVLVVCDFAENYSFVVQDDIQSGVRWYNNMVTIHPFIHPYSITRLKTKTKLVVPLGGNHLQTLYIV